MCVLFVCIQYAEYNFQCDVKKNLLIIKNKVLV